MFKIVKAINSFTEEIDEFDDFDEARQAAIKYQMAHGDQFEILVESGACVMLKPLAGFKGNGASRRQARFFLTEKKFE
jgi:hypothetical protein